MPALRIKFYSHKEIWSTELDQKAWTYVLDNIIKGRKINIINKN